MITDHPEKTNPRNNLHNSNNRYPLKRIKRKTPRRHAKKQRRRPRKKLNVRNVNGANVKNAKS